jgi:hypothetical protein
VSGTDPRDILYTDPVPRDPIGPGERRYTDVYRTPDPDSEFEAEAFHWGGLTAGNRLTALWILLAPFAFANVAGWMTVHRGNRFGHSMVRLAGLGLTALFVSQGFTTVVLLPYLWLARRERLVLGEWTVTIDPPFLQTALIVLALLFVVLFVILVLKASTQSHFAPLSTKQQALLLAWPSIESMAPDPPDAGAGLIALDESPEVFDDPAGAAVTSPLLWRPHTILHRLRRIHFAGGLGVVALALALWSRSRPMILVTCIVLGLLALTVALTAYFPTSRWVTGLTAWAPVVGLVVLLASAVVVCTSAVGDWDPGSVHTLTFMVTLALGLFVLLSAVAGWITVGALVIATLFGAILGIAIGIVVESILGLEVLADNGADWVAVAMLFLLWLLLVVAIVLSWIPAPHTGPKGAEILARRVILRARWLFIAAGIYGLAAGGVALGKVLSTGSLAPKDLGAPQAGHGIYTTAIVLGIVLVVLVALRAGAHFNWWLAPLALLGAGIVVFLASKDFFRFEFLKVSIALKSELVDIAVAVAILVPGSFMLRSIWTGFASNEAGRMRRRKVGILWDLGSFWPRWFHPLAPPAYGPVAVTTLRNELVSHRRDVLAAHSQGSLIGALASVYIDDEEGRPCAYLTYGSQLGSLYPMMYPDVGFSGPDGLMAELEAVYHNRWLNLYRDTDPIGGHYVEALGARNRLVTTGTGHSKYERTQEYEDARGMSFDEAGSCRQIPEASYGEEE